MRLRSPKLHRAANGDFATLLRYYAGYTEAFVEAALPKSKQSKKYFKVLDPWNGFGTTTTVACSHGFRSYGFDINPVTVCVARARSAVTIKRVQNEIATWANSITPESLPCLEANTHEPLLIWLHPETASHVRCLAELLRDRFNPGNATVGSAATGYCVGMTALIIALRKLIRRKVRVSNPTWIRRNRGNAKGARIALSRLVAAFKNALKALFDYGNKEMSAGGDRARLPQISVGSSTSLPLRSKAIDLVITSPPYCTRIDYLISLSIEIALLSPASYNRLRSLREKQIGTPVIVTRKKLPAIRLTRYARRILNRIKAHSSKAAESYYHPFFRQYLLTLQKSVDEICRVSKRGAIVIFVVQNSYFKDIEVRIDRAIAERMKRRGSQSISKRRFPVALSLADVHKHSAKYRAKNITTEQVLVFRR